MATSLEPLDPMILQRADATRHPQGRRMRDQLETDAWRRHPRLAARLARRRRRRHSTSKHGLRWQDRVLLVIAITLMALLLVRVETARADDGKWGLQLASGDARHSALALDTEIAVDVTGLSARVAVRQRFRNDGADWAEGLYRFPLPDGAAVDRMTIQVGERLIEGEIHERAQAEQVYAKARAEGRTAAMVEQERVNQFQTRLANIGPGEEISVFIGFLLPVEYDDDTYRLRLPMTFTPRYDAPSWSALPVASGLERLPAVGLRTAFTSAANPAFETGPAPELTAAASRADHRLAVEVRLRSGIEFASIDSPYHVVDILSERDGYAVRLAEDSVRPDRDFELAWQLAYSDTPQASLETWSDGEAVYAQLILVPPIADALTPQPREVMFIIDTSGSMQGASLEQAREALIEGLALLGPDDRFNVIRFATLTHALFSEPQPADGYALRKAAQFIERLSADGGTEMGPALKLALTQPSRSGLNRQVVFITDGSVGNEAELLVEIADVLGESRLFTVGIGAAPNAWFMRRAAEIGRGSFTQVGRADQVRERVGALWRHIRTPALRDLCVDWGTPAETYPEIVPDLYAGQPLWVTARLDRVPDQVSLCGELDGRDWQMAVSPLASTGSDTLAALWARRKLDALEEQLMFGVDPAVVREESVAVALAFGLLTRYTNLVAVDRTPRRPEHSMMAAGRVPGLLPAGSAGSTAFATTATGWLPRLLAALAVFSVAAALLLFGGARLPTQRSASPGAHTLPQPEPPPA